MMQLVAKKKENIAPVVHKVHIHVMYDDDRIYQYSKGEELITLFIYKEHVHILVYSYSKINMTEKK